VALNLAPDHLDRYASVADYYAAKERLFAAQAAGDAAVLNAADPELMRWAPRLKARILTFGGAVGLGEGTRLVDGVLSSRRPAGVRPILPASRLGIPGPHNVANALASLAALHGLGVDVTHPPWRAAWRISGAGASHRIRRRVERRPVLQRLARRPTPTAWRWRSPRSTQPVILIAGGRGQERRLSGPRPARLGTRGPVVTIGEAAATIRKAWGQRGAEWVSAGTSFERAVEAAYQEALARGGVVLLSPGCASFDMFQDYEDRGRRFKALVARPRRGKDRIVTERILPFARGVSIPAAASSAISAPRCSRNRSSTIVRPSSCPRRCGTSGSTGRCSWPRWPSSASGC
jgi:UDP-N-acetylmuramoylalanine--D-glutamate ligase